MITKATLFFSGILLCLFYSFSGNAQNTLEFKFTPNIINANSKATFAVKYSKSSTSNTYIQARLLSSTGRVVEEVTASTGSKLNGTSIFEVPIPNLPVSGPTYRWHTQMFSSDWSQRLAQEYYERTVIVDIPRGPRVYNNFSNVSAPKRVSRGQIVSWTYNFLKSNDQSKVHMQARLLSKEGKILLENTQTRTKTNGRIFVRFNIPWNLRARNDYKWNLQMYDSSWNKKLVSKTISGVTVGNKKATLKANLPLESTSSKHQVSEDLTISPNPFINSFEYEYSLEKEDVVSVELYALDGRKVKTIKKSENQQAGYFHDQIDTSDLEPGVYVLRINSSEGNKTMKVMKN